jgi:tetratricopeptide (TPR) repeat protein
MRFFAAANHNVPLQDIIDVINAIADITRYAKAIEATKIAPMLDPPAFYPAFLVAWGAMQTHASNWFVPVQSSLNSTIQSVKGFNATVVDDLQDASRQIEALIKNPNDAKAKADLKDDLDSILETVSGVPAALANFTKLLSDFQKDIAEDGRQLNAAAIAALKSKGDNETAIKQFEEDIKSLRDKIERFNTLLTYEDIATKAGIAIIVVGGLAGLGGFGGVAAVMVGVGITLVGGGLIGKILTNTAIDIANAKIVDDLGKIDKLNAQIGLLVSLNELAITLEKLNAVAQSAAAKISQFWKTFTQDVAVFVAEINTVDNDTDYPKAQQDLTAALGEWQALMALLKPIGEVTFNIVPDPVIIPKAA